MRWELDIIEKRIEALENPRVDIKVLRVGQNAKLPVRATAGSSGFDIHALDHIVVHENSKTLIPTGLRVKIPDGYELQVRPKSGLALKFGLTVLNTPGTIDSDYRGEIGVIMQNISDTTHVFDAGAKIAQIVCCKVPEVDFIEVDEDEYKRECSVNERGTGGFGSTGS